MTKTCGTLYTMHRLIVHQISSKKITFRDLFLRMACTFVYLCVTNCDQDCSRLNQEKTKDLLQVSILVRATERISKEKQ